MQYQAVERKLERLRSLLRQRTPALLACSGGLDSRLLAHLSRLWELDVEAVFFTGPHLTPGEIAFAREWLARRRVGHHVLPFNPLNDEKARLNLRDRCYHCKRAAFTRARILADDLGRPLLLDGSNFSDASRYRPGRVALKELGVESPLALAGFEKKEVRLAARLTGLDWPNQPPRPCLFTRLDYGLRPTEELLARLALAEDALARLGLRHFRLRVVRGTTPLEGSRYMLHLARDEQVTWLGVRNRGVAALRAEGFFPCKVELLESVSGWFDTVQTRQPEESSGHGGPM